jgi:hypothetical protein
MKYSPSQHQFYPDNYASMPSDAVTVAPAEVEKAVYRLASQGFKIVNGLTVLYADKKIEAKSLLEKSDVTASRCFKAGIAFPSAWLTYVEELRAILSDPNGAENGVIPTTPALPEGA